MTNEFEKRTPRSIANLTYPLSRPLGPMAQAHWSALCGRLIAFDCAESPAATDRIGREVRVAFATVASIEQTLPAENEPEAAGKRRQAWAARCRMIFVRPSVEPILFSYWKKFADLSFEKGDALQLASTLTGRSAIYARRDMGTVLDGLSIRFERREIASGWLADINALRADRSFETIWPIYAYARILFAHPFTDGNGRFARAFLLGSLGAVLSLRGPGLALAPAAYRHLPEMGAAFAALSASGDWEPFAISLAEMIEDALAMSETQRLIDRGAIPPGSINLERASDC